MNIETVHYYEWPNCMRLETPSLEVVVAQDFGPRIVHLSLPQEKNVFWTGVGEGRDTPFGRWNIFGGHRLWVAPESFPETYHPDDRPVRIEPVPGGVRLTGETEAGTGLQKSIEVSLSEKEPRVFVRHFIRNNTEKPIELAPWALSVMAQGGTAVLPLLPGGADSNGLMPTHTVSIWPYSDPADPRWKWSQRHLLLRQDPALSAPQKVGVSGQEGWAAYINGGTTFFKTYTYEHGRAYPDGNVSLEVYADHRFLEVESLGPLRTVAPGEEAVWDEVWGLVTGIDLLLKETEVRKHLNLQVQALRETFGSG